MMQTGELQAINSERLNEMLTKRQKTDSQKKSGYEDREIAYSRC